MTVTTLVTYGQSSKQPNNLITHHSSVQRMIWSDVDDEYMFFDLKERYRDANFWQFTFNDNNTGYVKMTNVSSEDFYEFTIYDWEIRENTNGDDYLWIDAIQKIDYKKVTIIVNTYPSGKLISVFMPDDKLAIFFDNLD